MKEKTREHLFKKGLSALVGGLWGTIDAVSTGLPILTTGLPVLEVAKFLDYQSHPEICIGEDVGTLEGLKGYAKSLPFYLAGALMPFAIKYHEEIYQAIEKIS